MEDYRKLKLVALEKIARLVKTASREEVMDGIRNILSTPLVKNASEMQTSRRFATESVCYSFLSDLNAELALGGDREGIFEDAFSKTASSISCEDGDLSDLDFSRNIIESGTQKQITVLGGMFISGDSDQEKIASDDLKLDSSLAEAINVLEEAGLLDD